MSSLESGCDWGREAWAVSCGGTRVAVNRGWGGVGAAEELHLSQQPEVTVLQPYHRITVVAGEQASEEEVFCTFITNLYVLFWLPWVLVVACRLLWLRSTDSRACGLSCPQARGILVPWPGIEPVPCIGRQIHNHRTTREVSDLHVLFWPFFFVF